MDIVTLLTINLDFVGKVLLGVMALMVHNKVTRERKIDRKVLGEMKLEQTLGFLAIVFFVLSYVLEIVLIK